MVSYNILVNRSTCSVKRFILAVMFISGVICDDHQKAGRCLLENLTGPFNTNCSTYTSNSMMIEETGAAARSRRTERKTTEPSSTSERTSNEIPETPTELSSTSEQNTGELPQTKSEPSSSSELTTSKLQQATSQPSSSSELTTDKLKTTSEPSSSIEWTTSDLPQKPTGPGSTGEWTNKEFSETYTEPSYTSEQTTEVSETPTEPGSTSERTSSEFPETPTELSSTSEQNTGELPQTTSQPSSSSELTTDKLKTTSEPNSWSELTTSKLKTTSEPSSSIEWTTSELPQKPTGPGSTGEWTNKEFSETYTEPSYTSEQTTEVSETPTEPGSTSERTSSEFPETPTELSSTSEQNTGELPQTTSQPSSSSELTTDKLKTTSEPNSWSELTTSKLKTTSEPNSWSELTTSKLKTTSEPNSSIEWTTSELPQKTTGPGSTGEWTNKEFSETYTEPSYTSEQTTEVSETPTEPGSTSERTSSEFPETPTELSSTSEQNTSELLQTTSKPSSSSKRTTSELPQTTSEPNPTTERITRTTDIIQPSIGRTSVHQLTQRNLITSTDIAYTTGVSATVTSKTFGALQTTGIMSSSMFLTSQYTTTMMRNGVTTSLIVAFSEEPSMHWLEAALYRLSYHQRVTHTIVSLEILPCVTLLYATDVQCFCFVQLFSTAVDVTQLNDLDEHILLKQITEESQERSVIGLFLYYEGLCPGPEAAALGSEVRSQCPLSIPMNYTKYCLVIEGQPLWFWRDEDVISCSRGLDDSTFNMTAGELLKLLDTVLDEPELVDGLTLVLAVNVLSQLINRVKHVWDDVSDYMKVFVKAENINIRVLRQANIRNNSLTKMINVIETFAETASLYNNTLDASFGDLRIAVADFRSRETGITFSHTDNYEETHSETWTTNSAENPQILRSGTGSTLSVSFPAELFSGSKEVKRIIIIIYKNSTYFEAMSLPSDYESAKNQVINSWIVSVKVGQQKVSNLTNKVILSFPLSSQATPVNSICSYWNWSSNRWDGDGIETLRYPEAYTECSSSHLTNFALLMDVNSHNEIVTDVVQIQALSYISYTGCAISLVSLILTLITYLLHRKLRKDNPSKILINQVFALALLNTLFLGLTHVKDNYYLCKVSAVLLHYALLASFFWMLVEAVYMYIALVIVFSYIKRFLPKVMAIGWGIPLVIVVITLAIDVENYTLYQDQICWLKTDALIGAVLAPIGLIILVNSVVFIIVVRLLCTIDGKRNSIGAQKKSKRSIIVQIRGAVAVFIALGLTWSMAGLLIIQNTVVFNYLFTICNSLQGFLVFLFYCCLKRDVQLAWKLTLKLGDHSKTTISATDNSRPIRGIFLNVKASSARNSITGDSKLFLSQGCSEVVNTVAEVNLFQVNDLFTSHGTSSGPQENRSSNDGDRSSRYEAFNFKQTSFP